MKRWIVGVAVLVVLAVTSPSPADIILPDLPVGSQYQLIFVTADKRNARSTNVEDYNAFVTAEAALNPSLPSATWHAVVSTPTVDARDNAPSGGLPVYNTQGEKVIDALVSGMYTDPISMQHAIRYNQYGALAETSIAGYVWTGSRAGGTGPPGYEMGGYSHNVRVGNPSSTAGFGGWIQVGHIHFAQERGMYALSDPITITEPVPEPSTLAMFLGLGGMGLIAAWRRRKRTA